MSETALARAELLVGAKRFPEARALLGQMIAAQPGRADAWASLAHLELLENRPADALHAAHRAVSAEPEGEWGHRIAAIASIELGDPEAAERAAREAVRLAPHEWQAHVVLSKALRARHAQLPAEQRKLRRRSRRPGLGAVLEEAYAAALRAVELDPHVALTHLAVAWVADAAGLRDQEREAYRRALEIEPDNPVALTNLAAVDVDRGRLAPAVPALMAALAVDPSLDVARGNLELLALRFVRRVHLAAFVLAVSALIAFAAEVGAPRPPALPFRQGFGLLVVVAGGAYLWRTYQRVPPALRRYVALHVRSRGRLLVPAALAGTLLLLGLLTTLLPAAAAVVPIVALQLFVFVNVLTYAVALSRGGRRR